MAIFQSPTAKRQAHVATPEQAGQVTAVEFNYTFSTAFAFAADKLELGVLPAGAKVIDMTVIAAGLNGNISIGLMSGEFGVPDNARTVGSEFFAAQAMTSGIHRLNAATGFNITPSNADRSIGLTGSADIAAGGAKTIKVILEYALLG